MPAVRGWFSCGSVLLGSVGENLFVDDGRLHLAAAVAASMVVAVDEPGDLLAGLGFGGEVPARQQLKVPREAV
jgi:hypothetical protein